MSIGKQTLCQRLAMFISVLLIAAACGRADPEPWRGPVLAEPRTHLTVEELVNAPSPPILDMSFFAMPEWAERATRQFSGSIVLSETVMKLGLERKSRHGENQFPTFEIEFLSNDGDLIPRRRKPIDLPDSSDFKWDVILGAGKVWHESGDADWDRASFPLSLTDRYVGSVRNCVAMFVYSVDSISNVYVQCSQETADIEDKQLYDIRASVPAEYKPTPIENAKQIIDAHLESVANRVAIQPLNVVDSDHAAERYFNKIIWSNASTSVGAVYFDGTLYVNPPKTRHGYYPYPDEMRHGVYSVSKSLVGAVTMFFFAERYGSEIFDERIADYIPAFDGHPEWEGVTFGHALNMVTGTNGSEAYDLLFYPVMSASTAEQAIENIAQFGDGHGAPGERFNYATSNFLVLSYALQRFVEEKEGGTIRYWDLVREHVLIPIGVEEFDVLHTRENNPSDRIPTMGYGARTTLDEAVKIARLIANEGVHEGAQLLNRSRIREALGRTEWRGYPIDRHRRYRHSFWSRTYNSPDCPIEVSYMQGFGSNHIIFMPSGVITFRFMDEFDEDFTPLLEFAETVSSSCE